MPVEIKVPDMGESVIEATIARWMKQEGDRVAAGEPVVELETDKINLEVGAQQAGVLQKINKQAGETVGVGDVLAVVEASGSGAASAETVAPVITGTSAPAEAATTQTQRAVHDVPPSAQPVREKGGEGAAPQLAAASQPGASPQMVALATPVALRMAQDKGVDLSQGKPSGSGGRITKEDVEAYLAKAGEKQAEKPVTKAAQASAEAQLPAETQRPTVTQGKSPQEIAIPPAQTKPAPAQPQATPVQQQEARETRERMSRRRQTIARRLVEAQHSAAMLTTFNEIDMKAVMDLRKRRREEFKQRFGVDLGFMSFFVKASIAALKAFPYVNAEIDGDEIIFKHYYDIGVAIGAEEGLVVPVIRDADRLNFAGVEKAIKDFVQKVKDSTLTLEDLRGGTFTITNGGVYGSLMSTPILNPPQVGILGMHAIKERPVVINGEIVIRPMMYIALSYDHRIVDGREAVQFLVRIKELVEDPEELLFG